MAHQYSRVGFDSSVEVNEVNLSLYYGGVTTGIPGLIHSRSNTIVASWAGVQHRGRDYLFIGMGHYVQTFEPY